MLLNVSISITKENVSAVKKIIQQLEIVNSISQYERKDLLEVLAEYERDT